MAKAKKNSPAKVPALESLAPRYVSDQHETYLLLLQEAVLDDRNLNIALTGRYGTGKSSILEKFESESAKRTRRRWYRRTRKTLRISISTLGSPAAQPASDGKAPEASLTNRIQKELVKQLIYRMSPRDFRFSRFNRIIPFSRLRATVAATVTTFLIGGMLWLFKLLPEIRGTGSSQWWLPALPWLGIGVGAVIMLATAMRIIHGRFAVSDVSAAGATVKLSPRSMTYFDEYSEDIVSYFNKELPDVVIFEDLDRFDDPHIFDALRELNTLLNQTPERRKKKKPLRFIYAIKDSLFEQVGSDADRANRTKFFDLVIPVVPFISHRNSRELLDGMLKKHDVTGIDRQLVALVARHTTDMRLLTNICNEYMVFSERLLKSNKVAPGLTETGLFALIAYKNFHLDDFEQIFRSDGVLQALYDCRRDIVRAGIDECEERKLDILNEPSRHKSMVQLAEQLAKRLVTISEAIKRSTSFVNFQYQFFNVGGEHFPQDQLSSYRFWKAVATANMIVVMASSQANGANQQEAGKLDRGQIEVLFPDALNAGQWEELDEQANRAEITRLDSEVEILRGADFKRLIQETRFTLSDGDSRKTFADLVRETVQSELALDLVMQGYLDRNFALYAAPFYGDFTGVDVATFIVQTVETNTMYVDYKFSGGSADIANLLQEAPDYFTRTISAYNVQIVDHLFKQNDPRVIEVADTVVSNPGKGAQEFLKRYFNSGTERERFAALLSRHGWRGVLGYLIAELEVSADVRIALVDAALRNTHNDAGYLVSSGIGRFIEDNYTAMKSFTTRLGTDDASKIVSIMEEAGGVLPDLTPLDEGIRALVVQAGLYRITANNLRVALGTDGDVSLDRVREHQAVYDLFRRFPSEFLAAIRVDERTPYLVLTEPVLVEVLTELSDSNDDEPAHLIIETTSPDVKVELSAVEPRYWPALAKQRLFLATVPNLQAYRVGVGSFDQPLAQLLVKAGHIDGAGADENAKSIVAVHLLNSADTIPDPRQRVALVVSMQPEHHLPVVGIDPEKGGLLALLLKDDLVEDSIESFLRFRNAGWSTIEPAIEQSEKFPDFMTPELISDYLPELLRSSRVPELAKEKILDELALYVPHDDDKALAAVGAFAVTAKRSLLPEQIGRIAAATGDVNLTLRLLVFGEPPVSEVVSVLARLGPPYSYFTDTSRSEFKVPADTQHQTILERLRDGGVVASFRKAKDSYNVKRV